MKRRVFLTVFVCLAVGCAAGILVGLRLRDGDADFKRRIKLCSDVASSLRMDALAFESGTRSYRKHLADGWEFDSYRVGYSVIGICTDEDTVPYSRCLVLGVGKDDWTCAAREARKLADAISDRQ